LRAKLPHLDGWTEARRTTAAYYAERLRDVVDVPTTRPHEYAVYHTFVIQADERDELIAFLARNGVGAKIHYPIPCHLQKAALSLGYRKGDFPVTEAQSRRIVSLPVYPALGAAQRDHVVHAVRRFYGER
jgi:dTDP-4-amino-4,6-dideoxygalactose transaminase